MDKLDLLLNVGETDVGFSVGSVGNITEIGKDEVVGINLSGKTVTGNLLGWWASLFEHPVDDGLSGSTTGIIELLPILEEVECWETLDAESFSDGLLFGGVDLGETERWVIFAQGFGSLYVFWGEFLAVSTPWSVEFDEKILMLLELFIKVGVSENENSFIKFSGSEDLSDDCE